jgi:hypothetical protein
MLPVLPAAYDTLRTLASSLADGGTCRAALLQYIAQQDATAVANGFTLPAHTAAIATGATR